MSFEVKKNILIIGGPDVGKTHFGGQLLGRLLSKQGNYQANPVADFELFKSVFDNLPSGKSAPRTEVSLNKELELEIEDKNQNKITFSYPDYAGEQIENIVNHRRINSIWKKYIDNSSAWMLFIRLDEIEKIKDIITQGIPNKEMLDKRNKEEGLVKITPAAFFVELLQIFLNTKGVSSLNKVNKPRLTVVLSCWDKIPRITKKTIPSELLKERLPLVSNYIKSNWQDDSLSVIGLSSTEKTLSYEDEDESFKDRDPEDIGYIITQKGKENKDLTISIKIAIGET